MMRGREEIKTDRVVMNDVCNMCLIDAMCDGGGGGVCVSQPVRREVEVVKGNGSKGREGKG